jgi:tetratricopeptide (TPR) repeat protein
MEYKFELANAICGSGDSLESLNNTYDSSGGEVQSAQSGYDEAIDLLEALNRESPEKEEYAIALAKALRWSVNHRNVSPWEGVQRLTRARTTLAPFAVSSDANVKQKHAYAQVLTSLGIAFYFDASYTEARQAFDEAKQILRELVKFDPKHVGYRKSLAVALGYSSGAFPPENDGEEIAVRKEELALFESLSRDAPLVPASQTDLARSQYNLGIALLKIDKPDPDSALQQFALVRQIFDSLCRENPSSKIYSNELDKVDWDRAKVLQQYYSTDEWLVCAEELRQLRLRRAERFGDYSLIDATAQLEWWVASNLLKRQRLDEGCKWGADGLQHLRQFLTGSPETSKDQLPAFHILRDFMLRLNRTGMSTEATKFAQDLSEIAVLIKSPSDRGEYYARWGKYSEAAHEFQAIFREYPQDHGAAQKAALLSLLNNDRDAYADICRQLLEHFATADDINATWHTLQSCIIASQPVVDEKEILRLADVVLRFQSGRARVAVREARGLAAYRLGDWHGALKWCTESRELIEASDPRELDHYASNLLIEAMALHHLGEIDQATAKYEDSLRRIQRTFPDTDSGVGGVGDNWLTWVISELLRREAEALLKMPETGVDRSKTDDRDAPTKNQKLTTNQ